MAMTTAQQTDMYRFFAIAFGGAPGVTYMNQLADALASGMTTKQVVNVFTTKAVFTSVYPNFYTNAQFAENLVNNVVKDSASAAAKLEARNDIVAALASGMSRGDVIYNVFNNLATTSDAKWADTSKMMANQVKVAQYFTEVQLIDTTNAATLQGAISGVTATTDVSTPVAIAAVIGSAASPTYSLSGPVAADEGDAE